MSYRQLQLTAVVKRLTFKTSFLEIYPSEKCEVDIFKFVGDDLLQEMNHIKKKLKYQAFLKCVLDFQLRSHEKYLKPLVQIFKGIGIS